MSERRVAIVDYGVGNLLSVVRAVEKVGGTPVVVSEATAILEASSLILPGVGAFPRAMQALEARGMVTALREFGTSGRPLLGICLGMQLLMSASEEFGHTEGLGLIEGAVRRIPDRDVEGGPLKVPHVGWSRLLPPESPTNEHSAAGIYGDQFRPVVCASMGTSVYFVHSYHAAPSDPGHLVAECDYGGHRVAAAVGHGAILGCQFHPEKSGPAGLAILESFIHAGSGVRAG